MIYLIALAFTLAGTSGDRYQELIKQYESHPETIGNTVEQEKAAFQPLIKIAQINPNDPMAFDALDWIVTNARFVEAADEAMDLLARDHIKSPRLLPVVQSLDRYSDSSPGLFNLLRAALRESPDRNTRAWATLVLGRALSKQMKQIELRHTRLAITIQMNPILKTRSVNWSAEENEAAQTARGKEAENLLSQILDGYADINGLVDVARKELFELRHLSLGCVAPEIEGQDLDGKSFKLSDYRGQVVVLYFWSQTCGPCVASFPKFRDFIKKMDGKPFAFLGVNCGDSAGDLRTLRQKGDITWRFWWDGPDRKASIPEAWNVWNFPTMYIIDPSGAIRYRDLRTEHIPTAVENLLHGSEIRHP